MQKWNVVISLITGYNGGDYDDPKLREVMYQVEAETKEGACRIAESLDSSPLSVWEINAYPADLKPLN